MDRETILGIKDLDRHLAKYVDDKDVLNMIVNKKYLELFDEQFFYNLLLLKYPLLIRFKKENETWKNFYIQMVYYLAKLKEEFDFPYIPAINYNPKSVYKHFKENPDMIWNGGLTFATQVGDMKLVEKMLSKGALPGFGLMGAAVKGDKKLVDYFIEIGATDLASGLVKAAEYGHKDLVDYFISLGAHPKYGVIGAGLSRDDDMFNYIISKYPVNLNQALLRANFGPIRYLIRKGANNLNQALVSYARRGNLRGVRILLSEGATNIEEARDAAAINGKTAVVEYLNTLLN